MLKVIRKIHDSFSSVLSDSSINKYLNKNLLIENANDDIRNHIQPNSIDLTIGPTVKSIIGNANDGGGVYIDCTKDIKYNSTLFHTDSDGRQFYTLMPNEFVLLSSNETLNIPNGILAFVQGRSSIARIGIQTEQAGLIDSGFKGQITFEVYNETRIPIKIYEGMRIAQIYFFKAQYSKLVYGKFGKGSKYQNQIGATGSRISQDPELINLYKNNYF